MSHESGDGDPTPDADPTPDTAAPHTTAQESSGFSPVEKVIGVAAGYKHPLITGVAMSAMLESETDPERRRQLTALRKGSFIWWGVGAVATVVLLIVAVAVIGDFGDGAGGCRGGADKTDVMSTTYTSDDDKHWTATYPCVDGGSTTVPIPRDQVPGGGR